MKRLWLIMAIILIFTSVYIPSGVLADETDGLVVSYWDAPPYKPHEIEPSHPRVFFTSEKIETIKANIDAEENSIAKDLFMDYVEVGISTNGITVKNTNYDEKVLAQIEASAFYYAIYKDDTKHGANALKAGKEAVDSISIIKNMVIPSKLDDHRDWGRKLNVLTEVYDWCYPLIKDNAELITDITNTCIEYMKKLEIWDGENEAKYNGVTNENHNPYFSPGNLAPVVGHGMEKENLRDLLSFAIAFSDVRPDVWHSFGGRFYQRFVPARKFLLESGYYQSGTDYGPAREYATACAYFLITGMGAPEPWSGEDMAKQGYANIYLRRPDGAYLYDGDVFTDTVAPFNYSANANYNNMHMFAAAASEEEAGYFKNEYFKWGIDNTDSSSRLLKQTFYDSSPIINLIVNNPEIKVKTPQNLPNSKYFPSPAGVMTARTGWDEGIDSSAVIANMKINEYNFAGHHHNDSGHFSIYYKGLLATDGGNYELFGDEEHSMYTKKSIAHNTMLIYDPSEGNWTDKSATNINDGGQVTKYNGASSRTVEQFKERNKASDVLKYEIDPENTQRPYYTYIKGELKNAYKDELNYPDREKVKEFKRSFMFLDLKDEKTPAALIVFDKVVSSDAKFKKMWLLHGVNKPTVDENIQETVFTNTDGDYNGQMINKTLLPKTANFDVVGGPNNWGVVRGWKYNDETEEWDITNSVNYGAKSTADKTENNEKNTYRLEISPTSPSEEDHFLNVIFVGDADETIETDVPLYERNSDFYGTKVFDRVVFFSRDGKEKDSFTYNISGSGTNRYTICDMKKGTYKVTNGGTVKEICVSEEGGVLSFSGSAGEVIAEWLSDVYTKPQDAEKENIPDKPVIRHNSAYLSLSKTVNQNVVSEIEKFATTFGYTVDASTENGKRVEKIYKGIQLIATIKEGDTKHKTMGGYITASVVPFKNEEGKLMMSFSELDSLLISGSQYLPFANAYYMYNLKDRADFVSATGYVRTVSGKDLLSVNAKLYGGKEANVFASLIADGRHIDSQKLADVGNNCFSLENKFDVTNYKTFNVKLYVWADGDFYPLVDTIESKVIDNLSDQLNYGRNVTKPGYKFHVNEYSNQYYLYSATGASSTRKGAKYTAKRNSSTSASARLYTYNQNTHYVYNDGMDEDKDPENKAGASPVYGIIHYSTNLRVNKLSGNAEQFYTFVRGSLKSGATGKTYYTVYHKAYEGAEFKFDVITDFKNNMLYIYENGVEVAKESISHWNRNGTIDHFIINNSSNFGKSEIEVFDSSIRYYDSEDVTAEDIKATINQFCILR